MTPTDRKGASTACALQGLRRLFGLVILLIVTGVAPAKALAPSGDEVFSYLNLDDPSLARAKILFDRGDLAGAKRALADHFTDRRVRPGFWPPDPRSALVPADIVRHRFSFYGSQPFDAGTPIRWNDQFLGDRELSYALNRHQQFAALATAWRATKNPDYAKAFVEQVRDWIDHNPSEGANTWAAWRNLEVGVRLGVWSDVFFEFLPAPEFTPEDKARFLASLHAQAAWLAPQVRAGRGDWSVSLATGLAAAGVLFPEFKEAAAWRTRAYDELAQDLHQQIYADGSHESLSLHRHNAVFISFWLPMKLALENHVPLPPGYRETLERMAAYQAYLRRPDGRHPAFNASDPADLQSLLTAAARFFGRGDIEYILTHGKSGTAPTSTSCAFRESGVYVMRDGWGPDANYLAIDAGPYGTAYQHEDKLGFELAAFGRTVIVDPGRYSLDFDDPLTLYFEGTFAHSTVTIDGGGQERHDQSNTWTPRGNPPNQWISRPAFDYFAGSYTSGYENVPDVVHARRILFVKDRQHPYWIMSDRITSAGVHEVASRFQFVPGALEGRGALAFVAKSTDTRLALCPPREMEGRWTAKVLTGSRAPMGGWVSFQYRKVEPAPQLIFDCKTSLPVTLEYALAPLRAQAEPPAVRRVPLEGDADATSLEVDFGDAKDTIFIAHDLHPVEAETAGVKTKGCFVVVRTPKSGKPAVLIDSGPK